MLLVLALVPVPMKMDAAANDNTSQCSIDDNDSDSITLTFDNRSPTTADNVGDNEEETLLVDANSIEEQTQTETDINCKGIICDGKSH